jgi:predicted nucleic acid-binding protein
MVFVDTNVFMYAVGRPHPLREQAQSALREATGQLATSAEVLQELLHAYLPVGRVNDLDRALQLATELTVVWPVDADDVLAARQLLVSHPGLAARDLLHLAICRRHRAEQVLSFDRALVAAFSRT